MKLSDAILMGSTTVRMEAGNWNSCALGAAANACGVPQGVLGPMFQDREDLITAEWPWLKDRCDDSVPYSTGEIVFHIRLHSVFMRFDLLVSTGKMSLEQLADFVREIEPDCPTCNRFECTCAKPEVTAEAGRKRARMKRLDYETRCALFVVGLVFAMAGLKWVGWV